MAGVNTANKRRSLLAFLMPVPDGDLEAGDRRMILGGYWLTPASPAALLAAPSGRTLTAPARMSTLTVPGVQILTVPARESGGILVATDG